MAESVILKDRWFGEIIPNGADLNNYVNPGYYTRQGSASEISNCPISGSTGFYLQVEPNNKPLGISTTRIVQRVYQSNNPLIIYYRRHNAVEWGTWKRINVGGALPQTKTILSDSVTGTTSADGNIELGLTSNNAVIGARFEGSVDGIVTLERALDGTWIAHLTSDAAALNVIANETVTVYFNYI